MQNNSPWHLGKALSIATLIAAVMLGAASQAAPASSKNPLANMQPVEASKNIELPMGDVDEEDARKGRYLVGLLGCASCHTDGALIGKPDPAKTLAGSSIGIAHSNPMINPFPGAVYPPNLTPDEATGLGS